MGPTQDGTFPSRRYTERGLSAVPTVLVRAGVGDRVDVGVGLMRADVKVNVLREGPLSVALDPIVRMVATQQGFGQTIELPVLAGLRVVRSVTLVGNAGIALLRIQSGGFHPESFDGHFRVQPGVRGGLGLRLQLGAVWGLQPEVTYVRAVSGPEASWVSGGIGVIFGAQR